MNAESPQSNLKPEEGWTPALPRETTAPTFWPAALALATTLVFWGLISSVIVSCFGLGLLVISLSGWIQQIRHERKFE